MGHTYNNTITNSGSGEQNFAQGDGAIAKQVNIGGPQASPEELLNLLAEIKERLPELPDKEQVKLRNAVEEVEMEAKGDKPDREEIVATLTRAQKVLKAVPGTVTAALPVGKLLGDALIWCGKMAGM
ncbi:MAG: hypothetical protein QTN59_14295 [Candidatus Electrothrix communis]|nr:hypothetical protein [Desulfobulbus sp. US4]WLE95845.1 MAG: hypothetical protein QTN59_14295 [Candidatus Electrothrix communis]